MVASKKYQPTKTLHDLTEHSLKFIECIQEDTLGKLGLKDIIYYDKSIPAGLIVASLIIDSKKQPIARGISIMSPLDNNRKVEGRVRSRGRAIRAFKLQKTNGMMKIREATKGNEAFDKAQRLFGYKSMYLPTATASEQELIDALKD
jgi:hypothetical protein